MPRNLVHLIVPAALVASAIVAGSAAADGLPVVGVSTAVDGVVSSRGDARYVALPAGRDTVVARIAPRGGRVLRSTVMPGTFSVPAVAYDGSAGGLSWNGRRLVLIRPRVRFPRARTPIAILDAPSLRVRKLITLRGDFSFDAISPRGSTLFLIQYTSRRDPTSYRVRAYDVPSGRLLPAPVVDPREPGEAMRGEPVTRATSPDGRWAYTLYDRAGDAPFVHALDLRNRTAKCIDLDGLSGVRNRSLLRLRVTADGRTLTVVDRRVARANIDTASFRVTEPAGSGGHPSSGSARTILWAVIGAAAALVGAAVAFALTRRGRREVVAASEPVRRGA